MPTIVDVSGQRPGLAGGWGPPLIVLLPLGAIAAGKGSPSFLNRSHEYDTSNSRNAVSLGSVRPARLSWRVFTIRHVQLHRWAGDCPRMAWWGYHLSRDRCGIACRTLLLPYATSLGNMFRHKGRADPTQLVDRGRADS